MCQFVLSRVNCNTFDKIMIYVPKYEPITLTDIFKVKTYFSLNVLTTTQNY